MAADHLSEKMKNVIWPEFRAHFRSAASAASYWSDLCEFAQITGADLTQAREQDVQVYYLDRVPIAFPWGTILLTNAAVFISACILLQAVSGILKRKDRQKKREKQHQRGEYTSKVPSS